MRVEVSPETARKEDCFLHVIQVGDQHLEQMADMELIQDGSRRGARLIRDDRSVTVTFSSAGDLDMQSSVEEH